MTPPPSPLPEPTLGTVVDVQRLTHRYGDRTALSKLPADAIFFGYGDYCFRLLHYAQRAGLSVLEMPVQYQTRTQGQSKSVFWKLLFSYTRALVEVRAAIRKQRNKPLPIGLQRSGSLTVQASRVQPPTDPK